MEWWRGAVLYQVYPRSFMDGNGDGVGDIPGLISRLDHIASLGVDGIWLSPVFASPMKDFGYDVADYCDIDPLFGTLKDFDQLVAECHARGLKLIIDQVYSHTSDQHAWFKESRQSRDNPKADWYVWADPKPDGSPPNNWIAVFGGSAWTWDSRRRQYYLHNFLIEQPDLNLHNPEVQAAILGVARFWLDRGVDGFRLDVANYYTHDRQLRDNPPSGLKSAAKPWSMQRHLYSVDQPETLPFVERLRAVTDEKPGRMMVAELGSDEPVTRMAEYTSGAHRFHTAYSFVFLTRAFDAAYVRERIEELVREDASAWPSWAFSNHDFPRIASRWAKTSAGGRPEPLWTKTLIALLTTLRGTAFLYQGEELGLPEAEVPFERLQDPDGIAFWPGYKGRDGCRTPMPWMDEAPNAGFSSREPWLPVDPRHLALSVARENNDPDSTLAFARRWLAYRQSIRTLKTGDMTFFDAKAEASDVLAFTRADGEARYALLFNMGLYATWAELPPGEWREAFRLGGRLEDGRVHLPAAAAFIAQRA
jgi:alpha-glucosidase